MQVRQLLTRSTLAAALVAAYFLADPAKAGPLGGAIGAAGTIGGAGVAAGHGGAIGGGGSGALGGGPGGIGLGAGGSAGVQLQRDRVLPGAAHDTAQAARGASPAALERAQASRQQGQDNATAAAAAAQDKLHSLKRNPPAVAAGGSSSTGVQAGNPAQGSGRVDAKASSHGETSLDAGASARPTR